MLALVMGEVNNDKSGVLDLSGQTDPVVDEYNWPILGDGGFCLRRTLSSLVPRLKGEEGAQSIEGSWGEGENKEAVARERTLTVKREGGHPIRSE